MKRSHQRTASASLDGVAVVVPTALGSTALVYAQVSPDMLIYGVHACMLALVWIHVITARAQRPMLYSARFFEATTLAVMLRQIIDKLPGWNLPDTAGVRLAFLCLIGAAAGLWVGCLWWMRAQRFTRYIPAPVYAGFANSIALVLVISQAQVFVRLLDGGQPLTVIGSIAGGTILAGVAARHLKPDWPSTSVALIAGVLISLAWLATGYATPMVSQGDTAFTLPVSLADFTALTQPAVVHAAVIEEVLRDAMILGTVIFLNTTVTGQFLAQGDDRTTYGGRDSFLMAFSMMLAGVIGSAPVSGATQASITASRYGRLRAPVLLGCTLLLILLYLSGLLGWVPIAAIAGSLFFEAWLLYDRPSFRQLGRWLKRLPMAAAAREDLLLIVTVTLVTVLVNILTAAFVGLTLGLVLYAARNSRQPLRHVWSGTQVSSNCARSRADLRLLAEHAGAIKVFELEGDQFFASAAALNHAIRAQLDGVECAVIDWSRVRHIDTSIAQTIDRLESHASNRSIRLLHASACREVALMLSHIPEVVFAPDLDRALETAENRVIQMHAESRSSEVTSLVEAVSMFRGMGPIERRAIEGRMVQRVYPAGEVIVRAGDPSDALLLVMEGTASVLMHNPGAAPGKNVPDIRLAGVRRGATIGEIGFLDGEPRSATVVAQDDVLISSITREAFDELSASHPHLVQRLLSNITVDLATRLRHTNQHALAKMGKT